MKKVEQQKSHVKVKKRTSIGSGVPRNKHKRRCWKAYAKQGRKHK